jgi:hypothetical protein
LKIKIVIIGILTALAVSFSGCAMNSQNVQPFAVSKQVPAVTASSTSEGILLNFENIQKDTYRVVVMLEDATENDHLFTYIDIRDDDLETLKSTGNLTCPYAENGHVYRISIIPYSNYGSSVCINVAVIATAGGKTGEIGTLAKIDNDASWIATVLKR